MKTLTVNYSKLRAFDAVKKASSKLELEIEASDISKGKLIFYNPGGLLSFGNKVVVKITQKNEKSVIRISSSSSAAIQLIDWGTNKSLEKDLIEEIREILRR